MTPREQLIQEIFQAPDPLIEVLLKLLRLEQEGDQKIAQQLEQIADQDASIPKVSVSAYDLAQDLAGSVKGEPTDLSTNPDYMNEFGL